MERRLITTTSFLHLINEMRELYEFQEYERVMGAEMHIFGLVNRLI